MTQMHGITIKVERDAVGHVAIALDPDGQVVATATGFGASDARRRLRQILTARKDETVVRVRTKKSKKVHEPAGVIFAAKRNIERYKARRVGITPKKT